MYDLLFPSVTSSSPTSSAASSNSGGGPAPNCLTGWKYCIDAGPQYLGDFHVIAGSGNAWRGKALVSSTATKDDVHVVISTVSPQELTTQAIPIPWTKGFTVVSNIYNFQAFSAFNGYPIPSFSFPVTIILPYTDTYLTNVNPKTLHIITYDTKEKRWITLTTPLVVNTREGTVATTVSSFSLFAVTGTASR